MVDWDNLRIFLTAVRAGNYTAAARRLRIDRTTVGRRLERLEHQLGVSVFEQGEDGYHPTPAGKRTLEVADEIARLMDGLVAEIQDMPQVAGRQVRLAVAAELGFELMPDLAAFSESHPHIDLVIQSAADPADNVLRRRSDIGLSLGTRQPDHLRARRLGRLRQAGYAARDYLALRGEGLAPQDYEWVRFSGWSQAQALRPWDDIFCNDVRVAAYVDSWQAMRQAVDCAMGAAFIWTFVPERCPHLVEVAPVDPALGIDLWIIARDDVPVDAPAKELVDFLAARLQPIFGDAPAVTPSAGFR